MTHFTACNNQLELTPISQISTQSYWKTESDASGVLRGMYDLFRNSAAFNLYLWGEARSEIMGPSLAGTAGFELFYQNLLTKNNVSSTICGSLTWRNLYTVIHHANLIIKYVPGIDFVSESQKKSVLAQAYTMRAYTYFLLTKVWGDAILITAPTDGYTEEKIMLERSPRSQVFNLIKDDIEKAIGLFENNSFPNGRSVWSRPAALALKADVYLWTGKLLKGGESDVRAALAALEEIEKTDVQLLDTYSSVFAYNNKGNKEILMAVRFLDLESGNNMNTYMYMMEMLMTKDTDEDTKKAIGTLGGVPYWAPTELVRGQFPLEDQRRKASFIEIFNFYQDGSKSYYGSIASKFKGIEGQGNRRFVDDVILYRHSDVLLMKAEAKNFLGLDPANEINAVRKRAFGSNFSSHQYTSTDRLSNDDAILKERLLEFMFEGKRWWDLIRFGKAFDIVPSLKGRKGQEHLLLFPIAESTLSMEPKVKQNPGYE